MKNPGASCLDCKLFKQEAAGGPSNPVGPGCSMGFWDLDTWIGVRGCPIVADLRALVLQHRRAETCLVFEVRL